MIIEFYGTPGAGKTYLASRIIDDVMGDEVKAENIVELGRSKIKNKAINKVIRFIITILPKYKAFKKSLLIAVDEYIGRQAKYNDEALEGFIDNIVYYSFWYQKLQNKQGLYIFDEGIVHQFVNIMSNYGVPVDAIRKMRAMIPYIPTVVYVSCENETNLASIKKRNRHVCYIDELTGRDLSDCITDYRISCETIESLMKPLTVYREDDVVHNVALIREAIGI